MQNFQDKRARRKLLYSHATILLIVLVLIWLAHAVLGISQKRSIALQGREAAESELNVLRNRKQVLEDDIARLSSPDGKEVEIRSKFQVAKPGEEVIIIIDEGVYSEATSSAVKADKSFWDVIEEFLSRF